MRYRRVQSWVNIGSGNGLLPGGTKAMTYLKLHSHLPGANELNRHRRGMGEWPSHVAEIYYDTVIYRCYLRSNRLVKGPLVGVSQKFWHTKGSNERHMKKKHFLNTFNWSPLDKMAAISQTIFSDAFSWKKSLVFWLRKKSLKFVPIDNNPVLVR